MPNELLSPNGGSTTQQPKVGGSADDVNNFFKMDENEEKADKEKGDTFDLLSGKKETKDKEDEGEDDEEIKLKGEESEDKIDLEKPEDEAINFPPAKQVLLKAYPDIFKKFPFFENMIYRDRQYTELFGSFDDAKEIASRAETLNGFEEALFGTGDISTILGAVKENDPKAYDKLVDNYLPALHKIDKEAYIDVVGNIGKLTIAQMAREAKASNNTDLMQAAHLLNQFLFGTSEPVEFKQRSKPGQQDQENQIQSERAAMVRERFESHRDELQGKIDNTLKSTISEYIDPKGEMSPYTKRNAVRDALNMLHQTIGQDGAYRKSLDNLWREAFENKFQRGSLDKIKFSYLGISKKHLKNIILKARSEALSGSTNSARVKEDKDEEETPRARGPVTPGRPRNDGGSKLQMKKGESVSDFFNRD